MLARKWQHLYSKILLYFRLRGCTMLYFFTIMQIGLLYRSYINHAGRGFKLNTHHHLPLYSSYHFRDTTKLRAYTNHVGTPEARTLVSLGIKWGGGAGGKRLKNCSKYSMEFDKTAYYTRLSGCCVVHLVKLFHRLVKTFIISWKVFHRFRSCFKLKPVKYFSLTFHPVCMVCTRP